jgi:hypothetical protein
MLLLSVLANFPIVPSRNSAVRPTGRMTGKQEVKWRNQAISLKTLKRRAISAKRQIATFEVVPTGWRRRSTHWRA